MKLFNKQILEAIQRGINLAIDDFDDMQDIETQKVGQIENKFSTKEQLELRKQFVDLGLPSGTWWGRYNIGVDPNRLNKATDWYGGYYAWGEIEEKQKYDWQTYKYSNGTWTGLTKYCGDPDYLDKNSKLDNLTVLQDEDDVAVQTNRLHWNNVKMPTEEQFDELLDYTTNKWVTNYYQGISGLSGRIFTSKTNGNEMFIPAAGFFMISAQPDYVGSNCFLWSRSLISAEPNNAYTLYFHQSGCYMRANYRYDGFSVRPVLNLK